MFVFIIDFADVLLAALLVGALFGSWLFLNPKGLNASAYVTLQQQAIRTMNNVMPLLGAATILLTITAAVLGRGERLRFWVLMAAALCFVAIGLITRLFNQLSMQWSSPGAICRRRTGRSCAIGGGAGIASVWSSGLPDYHWYLWRC